MIAKCSRQAFWRLAPRFRLDVCAPPRLPRARGAESHFRAAGCFSRGLLKARRVAQISSLSTSPAEHSSSCGLRSRAGAARTLRRTLTLPRRKQQAHSLRACAPPNPQRDAAAAAHERAKFGTLAARMRSGSAASGRRSQRLAAADGSQGIQESDGDVEMADAIGTAPSAAASALSGDDDAASDAGSAGEAGGGPDETDAGAAGASADEADAAGAGAASAGAAGAGAAGAGAAGAGAAALIGGSDVTMRISRRDEARSSLPSTRTPTLPWWRLCASCSASRLPWRTARCTSSGARTSSRSAC